MANTTFYDPTLRSELTGVRLSTTCGSGTLVKIDIHFEHFEEHAVTPHHIHLDLIGVKISLWCKLMNLILKPGGPTEPR